MMYILFQIYFTDDFMIYCFHTIHKYRKMPVPLYFSDKNAEITDEVYCLFNLTKGAAMIIADNMSRITGQNPVPSDNTVQAGKAAGMPENPAGAGQTSGASQAAQAYENAVTKAQPETSADDRQLMKLLSQDYHSGMATYSSTIGKALTEAGLAQNARNYQIASLLLDSGLSISKDSIRGMVTEAGAYPDTPVSVLIDMQKAGIEINPENIKIVQDFTDHSNSVSAEINEIADLIETILSDPGTSAELDTAIRLAVYDAVQAANESAQATPGNISEALAHISGSDSADAQAAQAGENMQAGAAGDPAAANAQDQTALSDARSAATAQTAQNQAGLSGGTITAGTISSASSAINLGSQTADANAAGFTNPQAARIVVETTPAGLPDQPATEEGGGSFFTDRGAVNRLKDPTEPILPPVGFFLRWIGLYCGRGETRG